MLGFLDVSDLVIRLWCLQSGLYAVVASYQITILSIQPQTDQPMHVRTQGPYFDFLLARFQGLLARGTTPNV